MATRKPTRRSKAAKAAEPARATKPVKPVKPAKTAKTAKTAAGSGSPRGRKAAPPPAVQRNASGRIDSVQAGLAGLRLRLRMSAGTAKTAGKARSDPRAERLDEVLKRLGERYRNLFR
jgi:hypothetical protein